MARQKRENLHKVRDFVYATRQDAAEVTNILLAEFPNLRILPDKYEWEFVDREAMRKRNEGVSIWRIDHSTIMDDPTGQPLPYLSSFADAQHSSFIAWLEPDGWSPVWLPMLDYLRRGQYRVVNEPSAKINFIRPNFSCPTRPETNNDPIAPRHSREQIFLPDGRMLGAYDREDPEAKAFILRAFRVMAKFFSTRLIPCNRDTLQPYWSEADGIWGTWVGPDAAAWGKQRRHNYLGDYYKPEGYKFRAGTKLWAGTPPDPDAWKALFPGGPEWEKRAGRVEKWLYRKERKT